VALDERMRAVRTQCLWDWLFSTKAHQPEPGRSSYDRDTKDGRWSTIVLHIGIMTTTIRIEETLKARVAAAAERAGKTAHAFMVDAIAQTVEQAELDEAFHHVADERWAKLRTTGKTVSWDAVKDWLEARSRGESPRKPVARKLGR